MDFECIWFVPVHKALLLFNNVELDINQITWNENKWLLIKLAVHKVISIQLSGCTIFISHFYLATPEVTKNDFVAIRIKKQTKKNLIMTVNI